MVFCRISASVRGAEKETCESTSDLKLADGETSLSWEAAFKSAFHPDALLVRSGANIRVLLRFADFPTLRENCNSGLLRGCDAAFLRSLI